MPISYTKLHEVNDEAGITAAITSLHKRAETLQMDIQRVLAAVAVRWAASGDSRPAVKHMNHLVENTNLKGLRKNAIKTWIETFMGLQVITEGDNAGQFMCPRENNSGKHLEIKTLTNARWWEFTPEQEYQPIADPAQLIMSLHAKMERDRAKAGEASLVTPEMLAALKAVAKPAFVVEH